jgi:hypothetical protein
LFYKKEYRVTVLNVYYPIKIEKEKRKKKRKNESLVARERRGG